MILRARKSGVKVEVVYNASVMGAAGACGLQLYSFGYTVSIPFFREQWKPESFYGHVEYNLGGGMHTLCLLDIKVKEPDYDALAKGGKLTYLPPRFMSVAQCCQQMLEVAAGKAAPAYGPESLAVGMARLGREDEAIVCATMRELAGYDLGAPLHCMVVCGFLHPLECEMLELFALNDGTKERLRSEAAKAERRERERAAEAAANPAAAAGDAEDGEVGKEDEEDEGDVEDDQGAMEDAAAAPAPVVSLAPDQRAAPAAPTRLEEPVSLEVPGIFDDISSDEGEE